MAKKKTADNEAAAATETAEPTEKKEKPARGDKPAKGEKAPKAEAAPAGEAPVAATAAPPAAPAAGEPGRKKKRPGKAPPRGKKLRQLLKSRAQKIAREAPFSLPQAIELLKKMKRAKFDETVEVHMNLGVDVSQSDQLVRGTVSLPHGIGKSVRLLVFCQGDNIQKAKEAGADIVGDDELIQRIQKENFTDFDVALATQDMMGKVSRLGKILGPRGLMPSPKAGTVVTGDIAAAVKEFKAGKVEYRTDKTGNIHAGVGKLSFEEQKLVENITTFVDQVKAAKPAGVRGNYIKAIYVSATMSPGIPVTM